LTATTATGEAAGDAGRRRRRVALLAVSSLLLALVVAEVAFRAAGLEPIRYEPRRFETPPAGGPFEMMPTDDDPRFFAYLPGIKFASIYDPRGDTRGYLGQSGRVDYLINHLRMREHAPIDLKASGPRVLCLGDSFTFGEGVHAADTYPARLEGVLNKGAASRTVQVLNAGVQGYGTRQELVFWERYGRALRPDVVVLGFVLNDACDVAGTIAQNEAMTKRFEPSSLASLSSVWRTFEVRRQQSQLQESFFRQIRGGFNWIEWDHCRAGLKQLKEMADQDGFQFLVVIFPIFRQLDGAYPFDDLHEKVAQACRQAGCDYIDTRSLFRDRPSEAFWVHPTDQHPNEIAHQRVAEAIAPRISEYLLIKDAKARP